MYTYELDTSLLPKVWLTWASTKNKEFNKRYWLNCQTGEKKETPEPWMNYTEENLLHQWSCPEGKIRYGGQYMNYDKIWTYAGANLTYFYAKYHKDIERLELAAVTIDTTRKAEPHPWKWAGDRFFLGKDKTVVDINGNIKTTGFHCYEWHDAHNVVWALSMLLRLSYRDTVVEEFKKFIGASSFIIGNGNAVVIERAWHIQRWYQTSQKTRGKGKEQKLTDELTAIELSDCSNLATKYPITETLRDNSWGRYIEKITDITYFERVDDNWSVLRFFRRMPGATNTLKETWRMYVGDNGKTRIATPSDSGWIAAKQPRICWGFNSRLVNKAKAKAQCSRMKYILEALPSDTGEVNVVRVLIACLRFPELEQLIKMGHVDIVKQILNSPTIKAELKYNFGGVYNDKEKNILKKVGLTKKQLDAYLEVRKDNSIGYASNQGLIEMRRVYGDKLTSVDPTTFKDQLVGYTYINRYFYGNSVERLCTSCGLDEVKFVKNIMRLGQKNSRAYNTISDTISMYNCLLADGRPTINWYFDDISDVTRAHDAFVALYNEQEAERRALYNLAEAERRKEEDKKRAELDKKRKEYEFEDGDYIIRLPKNVLEIIEEGSKQRICIGGYTTRHSLGQTNLFFLRKKAEEDKPFYAIEMDTHKNIVQIHGFGNKWLGNNPDAIPTVIRWCRKHDIRCDKTILTCNSTGYCGNRSCVEMPTVDGKKGI